MLQFHVAISVVGILSGLAMLYGLLGNRNFTSAIAVFLATTILTSLTGFPLPPFGFDPPRAVGVLSLILLIGAVAAYYGFRLAGAWRWIFVACAVAALYLNVFVAVAQGFMKVPALHALAPTQSEPPFAIVQGIVLLIFIGLGILAAIKFRPQIEARRVRG
jgi:hypothetical protein